MSPTGEAAFYDGVTARRRGVTLQFGGEALDIVENGVLLARWRYGDIRRQDAPASVLRLRDLNGPDLARLEVEDDAVRAEIARRCLRLDEAARASGRTIRRIVIWSAAAAASLVMTVIYLVPVAADLLAPLIPWGIERRLGDAVDNQVRTIFGKNTCADPEGRAALAKMSGKLISAAKLPIPATIEVLASPIPNAVALPGGRIYLFDGLLARAETPDEVAGVLSHELGHVAQRDGLRRLIQTGGSSFLLGLLFGDIAGSGAMILVARALIDSSHSREAEAAADRFAGDAMLALGRSPKPMGLFLLRITGSRQNGVPPFLASHPVSQERLNALSARDVPPTGEPLLSDQEWRALKSICRPA
jgi:predicted Zn-dependent protease